MTPAVYQPLGDFRSHYMRCCLVCENEVSAGGGEKEREMRMCREREKEKKNKRMCFFWLIQSDFFWRLMKNCWCFRDDLFNLSNKLSYRETMKISENNKNMNILEGSINLTSCNSIHLLGGWFQHVAGIWLIMPALLLHRVQEDIQKNPCCNQKACTRNQDL